MNNLNTMRDTLLEALYHEMHNDPMICFVSADFGAPMLDRIKEDFPARFYNVGIAEQNLINVSTGLALEGFKVFAYAIAPFVTMRCFEQLRVNVSIMSQIRSFNLNIIGVGAGVSYEVSGPTHHCLEDLSIINVLKNIDIFSCSDPTLAKEYLKFALQKNTPKYYRFDAKPLPDLASDNLCIEEGFRVLRSGKNVAVIATGFMSHKAVSVAKKFPEVTVIDLYLLNRFNRDKLYEFLSSHNVFITIEEGFLGCGGLDSCIKNLLPDKALYHLGFSEGYTFEIGDREYIHDLNGVGQKDLHKLLEMVCNG